MGLHGRGPETRICLRARPTFQHVRVWNAVPFMAKCRGIRQHFCGAVRRIILCVQMPKPFLHARLLTMQICRQGSAVSQSCCYMDVRIAKVPQANSSLLLSRQPPFQQTVSCPDSCNLTRKVELEPSATLHPSARQGAIIPARKGPRTSYTAKPIESPGHVMPRYKQHMQAVYNPSFHLAQRGTRLHASCPSTAVDRSNGTLTQRAVGSVLCTRSGQGTSEVPSWPRRLGPRAPAPHVQERAQQSLETARNALEIDRYGCAPRHTRTSGPGLRHRAPHTPTCRGPDIASVAHQHHAQAQSMPAIPDHTTTSKPKRINQGFQGSSTAWAVR